MLVIPGLSWGSLVGEKIVCITENEYVSGYVKGYSFVSNDEVLHYWGIVLSHGLAHLITNILLIQFNLHSRKNRKAKGLSPLPQDRPTIIALFTTKDLILYDGII